jgi:hypothetical protein
MQMIEVRDAIHDDKQVIHSGGQQAELSSTATRASLQAAR